VASTRQIPQAILFRHESIEDRIPTDQPLRAMGPLVNRLLVEVLMRVQGLYSAIGRPAMALKQLLRASAAGAVHHSRQLPAQSGC
jgi:hypothetical protein